MERISCFCLFPENHDFSQTRISLSTAEKKITVIQENDERYFLPAGTYDYTMPEADLLQVRDQQFRIRSVNDNELVLQYIDDPQIADDEVDYYFTR